MQKFDIKNEINFDSICRTCLEQKDEETNYIFDMEPETNISFLEMLTSFIKLQFNSKLPQKICITCTNCIKSAYIFKCRVEQNEKLLLEYLNNLTQNIKIGNQKTLEYEPKIEVLIKAEILDDIESHAVNIDNVYHDGVQAIDKEVYSKQTCLSSNVKNLVKSQKKKTVRKKTTKAVKEDDQIDETNFKLTDDGDQPLEDIYTNIDKLESTKIIETRKIHSSSTPEIELQKNKNSDLKTDLHNFTCEICNKTFNIQSRLKKHMVKHDPDNKKFECSVCHKKFTQRDNMMTHFKKFHDKTYVPKPTKYESKKLCIYCGKKVAGIVVHMRRHTGEKPFKCETCGRAFPRDTELRYHQRIHTGERPYLCTICGKGFPKSYKLKNHLRIHTGERPYKCTYCDQAFIQSVDLRHHIRRHTGEKPHECGDCGKRFIQKTALRTHCKSQGHNFDKEINHAVTKNNRLIQPI